MQTVATEKYQKCISPNPNGVYVGHAFCLNPTCPCHMCGASKEDLCTSADANGRTCIKLRGHVEDEHLSKRGPFKVANGQQDRLWPASS